MKHFNLVYKIKKEKKTVKRCSGSSVNGICFNKIKFLKPLPSCKSVHPLQRSYLKAVRKMDCRYVSGNTPERGKRFLDRLAQVK